MKKDYIVDVLKNAGIHVFFANETQINEEDVKIELIIENRRSGKTTRKILRAIADASEGMNVFFISPTYDAARSAFHVARGVIEATGVKFHASEGYLSIMGGGFVRFVSKERFEDSYDMTRGIRNVKEEWDL